MNWKKIGAIGVAVLGLLVLIGKIMGITGDSGTEMPTEAVVPAAVENVPPPDTRVIQTEDGRWVTLLESGMSASMFDEVYTQQQEYAAKMAETPPTPTPTPMVTPEPTPLPSVDKSYLSRAEMAAVEYLEALQEQDFVTALALTTVPEGSIITKNDFVRQLIQTGNEDIIDDEIKIRAATSNVDQGDARIVTVGYLIESKASTNTIDLPLILGSDASWRVDISGIIMEDWPLRVGKDIIAKISGVDMTKYKKSSVDAYYDYYTFPAVTTGEHTVKGQTKFGPFETQITPAKADVVQALIIPVSEDTYAKATEAYTGMLVEMANALATGVKPAELKSYYTAEYDEVKIDKLISNYKANKKELGYYKLADYEIIEAMPAGVEDSYIVNNTTLKIKVGVRLGWKAYKTKKSKEAENMSYAVWDEAVLRYEDGTWKIAQMLGDGRVLYMLKPGLYEFD